MAVNQANETRKQLALLHELQDLDNEIMDFEEESDKIPALLGEQENILLEKRKKQDENESQIHLLEDDLADKNSLLGLEKLKLKNTRNKETAIQNIKQYEAFVKEIETQGSSSDDLELGITSINKRLEELKTENKEIAKESKEIENAQKEKRTDLKARKKELDEVLEDLYDKRDEIADTINEDLFYKYEYISERLDGIAIAKVEHGHCLLCNMAIPPQMYNELIKGDRLMTCPACKRILFYNETPEDEVEEDTKKKTKTKKKKK